MQKLEEHLSDDPLTGFGHLKIDGDGDFSNVCHVFFLLPHSLRLSLTNRKKCCSCCFCAREALAISCTSSGCCTRYAFTNCAIVSLSMPRLTGNDSTMPCGLICIFKPVCPGLGCSECSATDPFSCSVIITPYCPSA